MNFLMQLDGQILLFLQENIRQEWMSPFWKLVTSLGNGGLLWVGISLLLLIPKKTRWAGLTALLALGMGALVTNLTLKPLVARVRPYETVAGLTSLVGPMRDYSFPSGHTCSAFAAASVYFKYFRGHWGVLSMVLAGMIAFSRLYVGVHYPTDVLCGLAVGLLAGWLAIYLTENIKTHLKKKKIYIRNENQ